MLTGNGAITLTPVPGNSTDFTLNVILTITGGSGKYNGATGTLRYHGLAQFTSPTTGTFNVIYRGSVCGPNLKPTGQLRLNLRRSRCILRPGVTSSYEIGYWKANRRSGGVRPRCRRDGKEIFAALRRPTRFGARINSRMTRLGNWAPQMLCAQPRKHSRVTTE